MSFVKVPYYKDGEYTHKEFETIEEYREFLLPLFKEPGQYNFDEIVDEIQKEGLKFRKEEFYCSDPFRSKPFKEYWDIQKERCMVGCFYDNGSDIFYVAGDYYMWLNYLPIMDKAKKAFDFPELWDVQYHMSLYEHLALIHYKHVSILKKRQIASSYYHMSKFIQHMWFVDGAVLKMGASIISHVDLTGTWAYLEEYRMFLNEHTAWYRPMNPGGEKKWQQQIEVVVNERKVKRGTRAKASAMSFEQSPVKGVGGPTTIFFYEEAGDAPTLDQTMEFILPSMKSGDLITGQFIAAGSVGKLKDAESLRKITMNPKIYDIYAVTTDLLDDKGKIGETGLFIPEQWGMKPYVDPFGNSQVPEALAALDAKYKKWEKDLPPEIYKLRISQGPRNIKEAFDYRDDSQMPLHLVSQQKRSIEEGNHPYKAYEIDEVDGNIILSKTIKPPMSYPVDPKLDDKTGVVQVWEHPVENTPWGVYYASVDPVAEGKTITSDSLCSIIIYKSAVEIVREVNGEKEVSLEGDKVVAAWCGRYDDINDTHKLLERLIVYYNAYTLVESNISLFIMHMRQENKSHYLVPKSEMVFLKTAKSNNSVFQEYGWKNTGRLFKDHLLNYFIEFCKEVIDVETDANGVVTKKTYGIERIPDAAIMLEMEHYRDGVNVDRLVTICALVAFIKIKQVNVGIKRIVEEGTISLSEQKKLYKFNSNAFSNIGRGKSSMKKQRSPFKRRRR